MSTFNIPANHDFDAFYQGQKIVDHPKKRAMSMLLAIVAGLLLYTGLKASPMDERMVYGGVLTLVYIFFGRNLMFRIKIKNIWKQVKETNPEIELGENGMEVRLHHTGEAETFGWADFRFYRIEEDYIFLYPKKNLENWYTLSLKEIAAEDRKKIAALIKDNIKIKEEKIKK